MVIDLLVNKIPSKIYFMITSIKRSPDKQWSN